MYTIVLVNCRDMTAVMTVQLINCAHACIHICMYTYMRTELLKKKFKKHHIRNCRVDIYIVYLYIIIILIFANDSIGLFIMHDLHDHNAKYAICEK